MLRFPFIAYLCTDCADESNQGGGIRERGNQSGLRFYLFVDIFLHVVDSQILSNCCGEGEYRQAFRHVLLHPTGQPWLRSSVFFRKLRQSGQRFAVRRGVEYAPQVGSDLCFQGLFCDVGLRLALQVHLAALPRHARQDLLAGFPQSVMAVADNKIYSVHAALLETG